MSADSNRSDTRLEDRLGSRSTEQIETALDVLAALSEASRPDNGPLRDAIAKVRTELWDVLDD